MSKLKFKNPFFSISVFLKSERVRLWCQKLISHPFVKKISTHVLAHKAVIAWRRRFEALEWKEKIALVVIAIGLLLFFTAPYSLLLRESDTLTAETERRGENLTRLLAASNQVALAEGRSILYSTASVTRELGVKDAWIIDIDGIILAPAERYGKTFQSDKAKVRPESCTRWVSGLNYQFACPIFKWVEDNAGFKKQITGYAYVDYTAAATLNFMSYRGFALFKFLTWFGLTFWLLWYVVVRIIRRPLVDFKFDLRAFSRGANQNFPEPKHFTELKDLSLEIRDCLQSQRPSASKPQSALSASSFFATLDPILHRDMLYLNGEKNVVYANPRLKNRFQVEENVHVLRAFGRSAEADAILDFISRALENPSDAKTETVAGIGTLEMLPFEENGQKSHFLFFEKD